MSHATLVMHEEEFRQMNSACEKLVREANVRVVFVIDKNGQLMASGGEADRLDSTSLASLDHANIRRLLDGDESKIGAGG